MVNPTLAYFHKLIAKSSITINTVAIQQKHILDFLWSILKAPQLFFRLGGLDHMLSTKLTSATTFAWQKTTGLLRACKVSAPTSSSRRGRIVLRQEILAILAKGLNISTWTKADKYMCRHRSCACSNKLCTVPVPLLSILDLHPSTFDPFNNHAVERRCELSTHSLYSTWWWMIRQKRALHFPWLTSCNGKRSQNTSSTWQKWTFDTQLDGLPLASPAWKTVLAGWSYAIHQRSRSQQHSL